MIPGSAPHIWENNLESDKRRDTALLLELLCLCAKKKEPLAALFCTASESEALGKVRHRSTEREGKPAACAAGIPHPSRQA